MRIARVVHILDAAPVLPHHTANCILTSNSAACHTYVLDGTRSIANQPHVICLRALDIQAGDSVVQSVKGARKGGGNRGPHRTKPGISIPFAGRTGINITIEEIGLFKRSAILAHSLQFIHVLDPLPFADGSTTVPHRQFRILRPLVCTVIFWHIHLVIIHHSLHNACRRIAGFGRAGCRQGNGRLTAGCRIHPIRIQHDIVGRDVQGWCDILAVVDDRPRLAILGCQGNTAGTDQLHTAVDGKAAAILQGQLPAIMIRIRIAGPGRSIPCPVELIQRQVMTIDCRAYVGITGQMTHVQRNIAAGLINIGQRRFGSTVLHL